MSDIKTTLLLIPSFLCLNVMKNKEKRVCNKHLPFQKGNKKKGKEMLF